MFEPQPDAAESAPHRVDRLILHQFDPARPSPGGIDTCLRGILQHAAENQVIAVVGVDTGDGPPWRRLGRWERYAVGDNFFYFLPVVALDPAKQSRRVPHSLRLVAGLIRFHRRLPDASESQAHRADTACVLILLGHRPLYYFIHTQEAGLTGKTSDSTWRRAASVHAYMERWVIRRSSRVAVFNPSYAAKVRELNTRARGYPTWYNPSLLRRSDLRRQRHIVWVGRLETPKDPLLAVAALQTLRERDASWTMSIVGDGSLLGMVREATAGQDSGVVAHGRQSPDEVAKILGDADVFLMTSHPGYEGFPRVLVEAMASGAVPVVTEGSDTGGIIHEGRTGYVTSRDVEDIADAVQASASLLRADVVRAVENFSAPAIVGDLYRNSGV